MSIRERLRARVAITMSIAPAMEDSDEAFLYGLSPNTHIYEYQDAAHYSAAIVREAKLLQSQQDRSQYVIFTNIDQEQFSRDFQDPTDTTAFESYFPRLQILMTKVETVTHHNASEDFGIALILKLSAMKNGLHHELIQMGGALVETEERKKRADQDICRDIRTRYGGLPL